MRFQNNRDRGNKKFKGTSSNNKSKFNRSEPTYKSIQTKEHTSSWQNVSTWYTKSVGKEGHYYHKHVVMPHMLKVLKLQKNDSILDLACGQGVLSRVIPASVDYFGVDIAPSLVEFGKQNRTNGNHEFAVGDVSKPLPVPNRLFSNVTIILALQNIEHFEKVFEQAAKYLQSGGKFVIMLNHPYFRIPRHTAWEIDNRNQMQYRRVNRYLSPIKIPIDMNPGSKETTSQTWSFHQPLSVYTNALKKHGFYIDSIDELISPKVSVGKAAKMENFARDEFPLFMCICAIKQ